MTKGHACPDCGSTHFMSRQGGMAATCLECQGYFTLVPNLAPDELQYTYNRGERGILRMALRALAQAKQSEANEAHERLNRTKLRNVRSRHMTALTNAAAVRDMATRLHKALDEPIEGTDAAQPAQTKEAPAKS